MEKPKENKYACMNSGCLGELCYACEVAQLWKYINSLQSELKEKDKEIHLLKVDYQMSSGARIRELKEKTDRIKGLEARLKIEIAGKQSAIEVLQECIAENKLLNTTEDNT